MKNVAVFFCTIHGNAVILPRKGEIRRHLGNAKPPQIKNINIKHREMKKISILFIMLLTVSAYSCSEADKVESSGKFVTASVTRGGPNAKVIEWDVNAAQQVEFKCVTAGDVSEVTVTLTGKTAEKPKGDLSSLTLKLTSQDEKGKLGIPIDLPATEESMKTVQNAVQGAAGTKVEVVFTGKASKTDVDKLNGSNIFVNVVTP